jgi:hypothetical protein
MKKRPTAWNLLDFLTLNVPALACYVFSALTIGGGSLEATLLLLTVGLAFTGIWVYVYWKKSQYISSFTIMTRQGVMVRLGGYQCTVDALEARIELVIATCSVRWPKARWAVERAPIWVSFEPGILEHPQPGVKTRVAGFATMNRVIHVGYFNRITREPDPTTPLEYTAFDHELGHVILGDVLGTWDEAKHHALMTEVGIR